MSPGTCAFTGEFSQTSATYFSFVTLATLGYGDIEPRADVARGLAIVEGGWTTLSGSSGSTAGQLLFEAGGPIKLTIRAAGSMATDIWLLVPR